MSPVRRIALVGAQGTGKTTLAHELAAHLRDRGVRAVAVGEVLRAWCERAGRTPRPEERMAIAREQEARVDAAAAQAELVIADTSALMVAIHAGMLLAEGELLRFALERQRACDATLLTGLDIAWQPDGLPGGAAQPREAVDTLLRTLLQDAAVPYQVVYGQGRQRLQSALRALEAAGVLPSGMGASERQHDRGGSWVWACEKCSDPACEHRLFAKLREARG